MKHIVGAACAATMLGFATAASAQDSTAPSNTGVAASQCELHVWPTDNYLGMNTGLLSGFGLVGAVADVEAHKGRVQTVKDLMRDYLGPEIQMEELNRIGLLASLNLPAETRIVVEEPTPFNEDLKNNPELKAKTKAMNDTLKAGKRLSSSRSTCYSELIVTMLFYQKAMMYGSNLFAGILFRNFGDKEVTTASAGAVKNPLEEFPPKTADKVDAAKAELRDAFAKDYREWLAKKKK